jgi:hypothetical protein
MSRLPKVDNKPKNNKSTKFRWVDSQWEKLLNKQQEDLKIIDQLRKDLITCNKFFQKKRDENIKLRIALCNLRDEYLDMGGNPDQLELFDKDDVSQLKLDFEVTDDVYKDKNTGDYYNIVGEQLGDYGSD